MSSKKCAITPHVPTPQGEVPSKFYADLNGLMTFLGKGGRKNVLPLYQKMLDPKFTEVMKDNGASFDEYGEITLASFLDKTDEGKEIPQDVVIRYLNKSNGFSENGKQKFFADSEQNALALINKIIEFNKSPFSSAYTAVPVVKKNGIGATVVLKDEENEANSRRIQYFSNLNKKLSSILEKWGIAVGDLNELERRVTNGYVDFGNTTKTADGLISLIRIAKGRKGEKALPEEFSHFAIRVMKDSPIIVRLLDNLERTEAYKDILGDEYDRYFRLYEGDTVKLAEEAAGHLLAAQLKKEFIYDKFPIVKTLSSLLKRAEALFKSIFSKFNENEIKQAVYEANEDLGVLADQLLSTENFKKVDTTKLGNDRLYQISILSEQAKTIWDKLYETTLRRQFIYRTRRRDLSPEDKATNPDEFSLDEQRRLIEFLDIAANPDKYTFSTSKEQFRLTTLILTMTSASNDVQRIRGILDDLKAEAASGHYKGTINGTCAKLRSVKDFIESYITLCNQFDDILVYGFNDPELDQYAGTINGQTLDELKENLKKQKDLLKGELERMTREYIALAKPLFIKALSGVCPEGAVLRLDGQIVDISQLVEMADNDISFMSRWLNSMANTSDEIAKLYDQIVKQKKGIARQEALDIKRRIIAAGKKLDSKWGMGARTQEFMYKKDSKGRLVLDRFGNPSYIEEGDRVAWNKARAKFEKDLDIKYASVVDAEDAIRDEKEKWHETNSIKIRGKYFPNPTIYPSAEFQRLTDAQKEFYHVFMDAKIRMDRYLPVSPSELYNPIMIRKEGLERLLTLQKGELWESIKDWFSNLFVRKETDDDYGTKTTVQDFSGREVSRLPIYFTKRSPDKKFSTNYSMDCVSNLIAYAQMATSYKALNQVINTLEVGRDLINIRQGLKKEGDRALVEPIKAEGRELNAFLHFTNDKSNLGDRLNDFMNMQVYGKLKKDKTILGKISSSKAGDFWATLIALNTTAINIASGFTNLLQGIHQINLEMFAHEYYNTGDILKANYYYFKHIWYHLLGDVGNPVTKSKLGLFSEDFNVMQDYESDMREVDFYRRNRFSRLFSTSTLFVLNNIGEHYLQHMTALALANHDKLIDSNGNEVSVFDAYEAKWFDPNNHSLGAYLTLKKYPTANGMSQVYRTKDGKIIITKEMLQARQADLASKGQNVDLYSKRLLYGSDEISEFDFKNRFSRKSAKINQDLHGIYNQEDKAALQQYALGRLAIMYRKHIMPNLMKRWKGVGYDFDIQNDTEGFQRTAAKFWLKLFKELIHLEKKNHKGFGLGLYHSMSAHEQANMRRSLGNIVDFATTVFLLNILSDDDDDDEDETNWFKSELRTVLYRFKSEVGAYTFMAPLFGFNPIQDWLRVFKEPIIGMNWLEKYIDLVMLLYWGTWTTEVEHGKYAGYTQAQRILFRSFPFIKQMESNLNPDEASKMYK